MYCLHCSVGYDVSGQVHVGELLSHRQMLLLIDRAKLLDRRRCSPRIDMHVTKRRLRPARSLPHGHTIFIARRTEESPSRQTTAIFLT